MPDYNLSSAELYAVLHGALSISNQEIQSLGFDLPQCQEQEVEPSVPKTRRRKSSHER